MKALRRSQTSTSSSSSPSSLSTLSSRMHLRSLLIVTFSPVPDRGTLKSPWSRRKRKRALTRKKWCDCFTPEGKLRHGGAKFLKKVRSAGVDPSIRAEVWPFLLGIYNLNSSRDERNVARQQKREEYEKLRKRFQLLLNLSSEGDKELKEIIEVSYVESPSLIEGHESPGSEDVFIARGSLSVDRGNPGDGNAEQPLHDDTSATNSCNVEEDKSGITYVDDASVGETESSDTESFIEEPEGQLMCSAVEENMETNPKCTQITSIKRDHHKYGRTAEDFATWQRIIRLDAIRANAEWAMFYPAQASVSEDKALESAIAVGLKDYNHLEPCRVYHAARLVAILETYALYDPEIGYCQGMSDLLSPILAVMEEDYEAFWCFVGLMRKARHNFRLDEVGIRRQLNIVSKIIKSKDLHLYRHLEKLQAEDCFFVYRMVVVMFCRELTFEQTLCLWEVMWADQAAIRAGFGKSVWGRIRLRAPPTDDLLLYAIAACVLQRRLIIERYSSMDEIIRECNNMAGQLDVWKLLDDAHDLVVTLHDKIE